MLLYLVQHAEAKREEEDPSRSLSEKGLQDIKRVAVYAEKLNIKISQIFHSGKTRALQTAEVLADHLKPEKGITQTDGLSPMDEPQIWADRILKMQDATMLVGHLPHLARLASLLLCGDKNKGIVNFKMGGIVCLSRNEDGKWSVEWMIIPVYDS
ncbi:MAG: phosphohistidine phosphatase SixA [Nitrospira sp.]|nr:phosphohistidine phosphatase SixA [Nitrospira sp.]